MASPALSLPLSASRSFSHSTSLSVSRSNLPLLTPLCSRLRLSHPTSSPVRCMASAAAGGSSNTTSSSTSTSSSSSSISSSGISGTAVTSSGASGLSIVEEDDPTFWERIQEHQKAAARLPPVDEARTLLERCTRGILSTTSQKYGGYPFGSAVTFASDESGSAILAVSSLSPHTADLLTQPKCSLLISKDLTVPAEPTLAIIGDAETVDGDSVVSVRARFLKRHPTAFWVDFGDFRFIRIRPRFVRLTANIATFAVGASVSEVSAEEFVSTTPDSIAEVEGPISAHMNADHENALIAIAQQSLRVKVPGAKMLTLDRRGFVLEIPFKDQSSRIRVPFPREATSRKEVKDILVEMTKAARTEHVEQST